MTTALSPKTAEVLSALRATVEGCTTSEGAFTWRDVYLDNARPDDMTGRSFAGHLSALERVGLYRSQGDDCFGSVRMED